MTEYGKDEGYIPLVDYTSKPMEADDAVYKGSLLIQPKELELLAELGFIKPLGNGKFSLSTELSSKDRPPVFRASINKENNAFALSGNTKGLNTLEAIMGELRYRRDSDKGGMLAQEVALNHNGYGAMLGEDRYGGRQFGINTPDFGVSRYKNGGFTDTTIEGDRWRVGRMRDRDSRYSETYGSMRFGDRYPGNWQTEVGGVFTPEELRRIYVNAVRGGRRPEDPRMAVGASVDNHGEPRFNVELSRRF